MRRSFGKWFFLMGLLLVQGIFLVRVASVQASPGGLGTPGVGSINQQINYQAKLSDASGVAVADGTYNIKFSLYTQSSGGSAIWTASGTTGVPTAIPVTVSNGLFTVLLGDTSAAGGRQNAFTSTTDWNAGTLYLGVTVGTDSEMTPRKAIGAVPQAMNAMQLQGMSASGTSPNTSLFFIDRRDGGTSGGAARSALDVRTQGADPTNDYIVRFLQPTSNESSYVSIRNDGFMQSRNIRATISAAGAALWGDNNSIATNAWGGHMSTLLVGTGTTASFVNGADQFASIMRYSGSAKNALCLDDTDTVGTCAYLAGASLIADGTINANQFDLAERYSVTGEAEPGDLVSIDRAQPMFVKKSAGVAYDNDVIGIVTTHPGFLLGSASGTGIALAGRVPTKVSAMNGAIATGDLLTSSPIPGVAMKAAAAGHVIGYALQPASTTSTIEVFVHVGYDPGAGASIDDHGATLNGGLLVNATTTATTGNQNVGSCGLTIRGSAWDGTRAVNKDFVLGTNVVTGSSTFNVSAGTSTLLSLNELGSLNIKNDLLLGGRFFPATRSGVQTDKYVFLDDSGVASSTYIATNADGWQADDSYDFAERYYSPDALEAGDLVVISQRGQFHVQRTMKAGDVPIGIVSTRPGFVAGAPAPSTFPIALAGRVPTKVSAINGPIAVGDPLTASSLPGVAVKALQAGPIVGYALEAYSSPTLGNIEVFVNAGWWGGSPIAALTPPPAQTRLVPMFATNTAPVTPSHEGVARILAGATKVSVAHASLGTFPLIQVTPYGKVDTQWWTDHSTDHGFEIFLKEPLGYDVTFSWRAEAMLPTNDQLFLSDGTVGKWDIHSGEPIFADTSTPPPTPTSTTTGTTSTSTSTSTTPTAVIPTSTSTTDGTTTSTDSLISAATSTEVTPPSTTSATTTTESVTTSSTDSSTITSDTSTTTAITN